MVDGPKVSSFVESSPYPMWLATIDGRCTYANTALEQLIGLRPAQMVDVDWRSFLLEEDRASVAASWQRALATGTPCRTWTRVRCFDGLHLTVELIAFGHSAGQGSGEWLFTILPVHGSTVQSPPLEAHLRATLNVIPAHVWYTAPSGALLFVNERIASFLGLPEDDPLRFGIDVGGAWDLHVPLLHPDDREEARRVWGACLRTGCAGEIRFRVRNAEGVYRWFLSRAEPLKHHDGTLLYWIGVNVDIDDERRAEEALNAVRQRLARATEAATAAELSASIAHEIVQPLSAVVANARAAINWISADKPSLSQAQSLMEKVLRDGMSIGDVVQRIRALFKRQPPKKTAVLLNELVDQVLLVVANELRAKHIAITLRLMPGLPSIEADPVQIQQVLVNLIRNAMEAFPSDSSTTRRLSVETSANAEIVMVSVEDNGPGVTDADKIFEPFFTSKDDGLGIGLAISRSIAEAHGGTLVATSASGGGACFRLSLPFDAPKPPLWS